MSTKTLLNLKGQDLVEFATGSSGERISVILEARRPKLAVPISRPLERVGRRNSSSNVSPTDPQVLRSHMANVAQALEQLGLRRQARIAELAGCFVVEVTRQELLALAESPSIQAIRVNRVHRRLVA